MASIITPFVPSHSSNRVSRSNPGSWLILRPSTNTWQPWGRLDAWRESNKLGYRFTLLPESTTRVTSDSTISTKKGGKFTIDIAGGSTPVNSPRSSCEYASRRSSRAGSESGSECGFGLLSNCKYGDFVMSSTVEGAGRRSRPEVEVGVKHITCTEDAAVFVALAAAMDLCMDACRLFSHKLRKELRD